MTYSRGLGRSTDPTSDLLSDPRYPEISGFERSLCPPRHLCPERGPKPLFWGSFCLGGGNVWVKTMVLACLARARARRSPAKRSTFSSVIEDSLLERKKSSRIGPRNFPVFSVFLTKMDQKMTVFELIPLQWGECVQDHPREEESREVGERTGIG